jgi:hypothetical protein
MEHSKFLSSLFPLTFGVKASIKGSLSLSMTEKRSKRLFCHLLKITPPWERNSPHLSPPWNSLHPLHRCFCHKLNKQLLLFMQLLLSHLFLYCPRIPQLRLGDRGTLRHVRKRLAKTFTQLNRPKGMREVETVELTRDSTISTFEPGKDKSIGKEGETEFDPKKEIDSTSLTLHSSTAPKDLSSFKL